MKEDKTLRAPEADKGEELCEKIAISWGWFKQKRGWYHLGADQYIGHLLFPKVYATARELCDAESLTEMKPPSPSAEAGIAAPPNLWLGEHARSKAEAEMQSEVEAVTAAPPAAAAPQGMAMNGCRVCLGTIKTLAQTAPAEHKTMLTIAKSAEKALMWLAEAAPPADADAVRERTILELERVLREARRALDPELDPTRLSFPALLVQVNRVLQISENNRALTAPVAGADAKMRERQCNCCKGMPICDCPHADAGMRISAAQISALDDASNACLELAARHGFATGHGDTVADIIREFSAQIPDVGMRERAVVERAKRWAKAQHHGGREEVELQATCLMDAVNALPIYTEAGADKI